MAIWRSRRPISLHWQPAQLQHVFGGCPEKTPANLEFPVTGDHGWTLQERPQNKGDRQLAILFGALQHVTIHVSTPTLSMEPRILFSYAVGDSLHLRRAKHPLPSNNNIDRRNNLWATFKETTCGPHFPCIISGRNIKGKEKLFKINTKQWWVIYPLVIKYGN